MFSVQCRGIIFYKQQQIDINYSKRQIIQSVVDEWWWSEKFPLQQSKGGATDTVLTFTQAEMRRYYWFIYPSALLWDVIIDSEFFIILAIDCTSLNILCLLCSKAIDIDILTHWKMHDNKTSFIYSWSNSFIRIVSMQIWVTQGMSTFFDRIPNFFQTKRSFCEPFCPQCQLRILIWIHLNRLNYYLIIFSFRSDFMLNLLESFRIRAFFTSGK